MNNLLQGDKFSELFLNVPLRQWAYLFVLLFLFVLLKPLLAVLFKGVRCVTTKTKNKFDDKIVEALVSPSRALFAALLCYVFYSFIDFHNVLKSALLFFSKAFWAIGLLWAVYRLVDVFVFYLTQFVERTENKLDDQLLPLLAKTLKLFVLIAGVLTILQNFGVNVLSLLTGLGLGGLAFALAAKDMAANFFGSLMILFDRPFAIGDWIAVDGNEGVVEEIGFRSTRIRTFYNSQVSIPNSVVANKNIDNYGRREYRRVKTVLNLVYSTKPEKMQQFTEGIKSILEKNAFTKKDNYHVVFNNYSSSSLDVLVYFFLQVKDWKQELAQKEDIYSKIYLLADRLGVDFAYPTQSLYIEQKK